MLKSTLCVACASGLGFAIGTLFPVSAVSAASITNLDSVQHTVTIVTGETTTNVTVEPSQTLDGLCPAACIVGLPGEDGQYEVAANDQVTIEHGEFFFQSEEETSDGDAAGDDNDTDPVEDTEAETESND